MFPLLLLLTAIVSTVAGTQLIDHDAAGPGALLIGAGVFAVALAALAA